MKKVKEWVGPTGLQVPQEILERCGLGEGTPVIIELHRSWIKIVPEIVSEEIENIALSYLLNNLGDTVGIDTPVLKDGQWTVPVVLPYARKRIGQLVFSPSGNLLIGESSPMDEMLRKVNEA